ncbi:hypothetical protein K435DRAFT_775219 [Dendrothele bispora CBS 962.96]|uniref:Transcription and mRNA export factor SUS1 n=1 Tax=Dendrothele bispora (strain CBS 962.96) TaxID=1314807 RepID=A0A4S8MLI7_DENBC|nr:hypothetical protein K435DRAFT_775219 [Dendrothele bispora CBS 962.96]
MPASQADVENFRLQIQRRLIESGDWEKLMATFMTKLNESGWVDEMMQKGKNAAQDMEHPRFEAVRDALSHKAHKDIPLQIRRETLQSLKQYLEKQFD